MKKVLFVLSILLVLTVAVNVPTSADGTVTESGTWGDLSWTFDVSTGTLTVSGNGEMPNLNGNSVDAWSPYTEFIQTAVIEEGVTTIGNYAFFCCLNLETVVIPNGITSIGKQAFMHCSKLSDISIPSSVTEIGEMAFHWGSETVNVYVSDLAAWCAIDFEGSLSNPLYFATYENLYLNGLPVGDTLIIPEGVTKINAYAFCDCDDLTAVHIPNSVTEIEAYAFSVYSNTVQIIYFGSSEQWDAIAKDADWDAALDNYTVSYHEAHTLQWSNQDNQSHRGVCSVCGETVTEDHAWHLKSVTIPTHLREGAQNFTCRVCNAVKTESVPPIAAHDWSDYISNGEDQHYHSCPCGEIEYMDHVYDSLDDTECDLCGYSVAPEINTGDLTLEPSIDTAPPSSISDGETEINLTPNADTPTTNGDMEFYVGCRSSAASSAAVLLISLLGTVAFLRKRK